MFCPRFFDQYLVDEICHNKEFWETATCYGSNKEKFGVVKIIFFEACDFTYYPIGGTLSFAKQLINSIPQSLKLVGFVNEEEPVGRWFIRNINGHQFDYFGICRVDEISKTKLPKRIYSYLMLRKHIDNILNNEISIGFTQSPQFVFILGNNAWMGFYFLFAGLGNSVGLSKYKFLRIFGGLYEQLLFKYLTKCANLILAASDSASIKSIKEKYNLPDNYIIPFPTRFNCEIFKVVNQREARIKLGIPLNKKVYISVGRISYIKGWKFMVDSYHYVTLIQNDTLLLFVGNGEDSGKLKRYCRSKLREGSYMLLGQLKPDDVATCLNASDVFVMGSIIEGWPTAMVEALACGKPIVSTKVSGAYEMIDEGINGFIASNRDTEIFSNLLINAISLENPNKISVGKAKKYSTEKIGDDFLKIIEYDRNKRDIT